MTDDGIAGDQLALSLADSPNFSATPTSNKLFHAILVSFFLA